MIRQVTRLRFNPPEPQQIRANALAGIMKNGDEGNAITFDDVTGLVYLAKAGTTRVLHVSNCAWIEYVNEAPKK